MEKSDVKHISLSEASSISGISRDYLNVLIRRGKLKAIKIGENWLTTESWLSECRKSQGDKILSSEYLSLFAASKIANVTPGYLNVAVRRGKLHAVKLGRNWFTTSEWLKDYQRSVGRFPPSSDIIPTPDVGKVWISDIGAGLSPFFTEREKQLRTESLLPDIKLSSRELKFEEKSKILEAVEEQFKSTDVSEFQEVSKQLGILKSLKSWSHLKFSLASGVVALVLIVSLGVGLGFISLPSLPNFNGLKYQASIFSDVLKNFPSDLSSFSRWLVSGLNKSLSLLKSKSPSELTIEALESGKSKLLKPEETPYQINTLAEAEALDSPSEALATEGEIPVGGSAISVGASEFKLLENRLSIVEVNLKDQTDLINSELSLQKRTILGTLETLFGLAKLVPSFPLSTVVVQGQPATLTTYSIAPQVQSGFDRLSASYLTLSNNAEINGSLTVKSGANLNSLSVSGDTSLTGNTTIGGTLNVSGNTTLGNLTVNGSFSVPGGSFGNASTTNLTVSNKAWINQLAVTGTATTTFNNPIASFSGNFIIAGDSASNLLLNPYGGNVGIGTTSPNSLLSVNSTGNVYFGGTLTVSGQTSLVNASTSILTAPTLFSTNGTITNASTTYLTVSNNLWGNVGQFATSLQTPLIWNNGTLTASTTGANPIIFAANSLERMRIDESGKIFIATTTMPSNFGANIATSTFVYGNQFINGGLGVGVATTTTGAIQTSGDVFVGRNLRVAGNSTTIGASSADTLTVSSSINSNLIPDQNSARDFGSTSFYWRNAYVSTLTVNSISAASTTIGGTQSETFTINSDNASADSQDSSLIFFRGTVVPNAILTWNSATSSKRFEFNQALYLNNGSASTTNPTLTVQTIANQTANGLQVIGNNSSNLFSVSPVGSQTTMINASTTNLTVSSNLWANYAAITNASTTYATLPTFWATTGTIGALSLTNALTVANGGTGASTLSGLLQGNGASAITGVTGTAGQIPYYNGTNTLLATSTIFLSTSGNVGIGTTNPGALLDIQGAAQFGTTNINLIDSVGKIAGLSTSYFNTDTSASLAGIITDKTGSGVLVFGTSPAIASPTLSGSVAGTYTLGGTPTLGVNLALGGATRTIGDTGGLSITTAGNVGIGTTSPGSLFSVHSSGNVYFGGALTVSGNSLFQNATTTGLSVNGGSSLGSLSALNVSFSNATTTGLSVNGGTLLGSLAFGNATGTALTINGGVSFGSLGVTGNSNLGNATTTGLTVQGGTKLGSLDAGNASTTQLIVNGTALLTTPSNSALAFRFLGATSTLLALDTVSNTIAIASSTWTPSNILTVQGNAYINGALTVSSCTGCGGAGSGTAGQIPYYASNGTTLTPTSTIFLSTASQVGIGTTTPNNPLTVQGNAYINGKLTVGTSSLDLLSGNIISNSGQFNITNAANTALTFSTNNSERVRIDNSGNVGIGTTMPGAFLHISGAGNVTYMMKFTSTSGGRIYGIGNDAQGSGIFSIDDVTAGSARLKIDSTGIVTIPTAGPALQLPNTDNQILIGGTTDPGWTVPAIQMGNNAILSRSTLIQMASNSYNDGTEKYITTSPASRVVANGNDVTLDAVGSGTAGTAVTYVTQLSAGVSGVQIGSPIGGYKGLGTINVAADIYKNGTAYTNPDYVFEKYYTGQIVKFAGNDGASTYLGLRALSEVETLASQVYELPLIASSTGGLFGRGDALLASLEESYLYLFDHEKRIKELASTTVSLQNQINALNQSFIKATSTLQASQGAINLTSLNSDLNLNGFSILNVKSITGMNGLWKIDENGNVTAQSVTAQAITVAGAASGVTIYDRGTSAPKCIYIEGGVIKTSDGACGQTTNVGTTVVIQQATDNTQQTVTTTTPSINSGQAEPISTASSTPIVTATSEPVIVSTTTIETATTTP